MKRTFTLVDLLVVIAIVGIMALMLIPAINRVSQPEHTINDEVIVEITYSEWNDLQQRV